MVQDETNTPDLEAVFGGPSDDAFGSAVFRHAITDGSDLEAEARSVYEAFVGEAWSRFGAETWLSSWAEVAAGDAERKTSVVDLLAGIDDPQTRLSATTLVEGHDDPTSARLALTTVFDRPSVTELRVFSIGDGVAMTGLIVVARDSDRAEAIVLAFLMD